MHCTYIVIVVVSFVFYVRKMGTNPCRIEPTQDGVEDLSGQNAWSCVQSAFLCLEPTALDLLVWIALLCCAGKKSSTHGYNGAPETYLFCIVDVCVSIYFPPHASVYWVHALCVAISWPENGRGFWPTLKTSRSASAGRAPPQCLQQAVSRSNLHAPVFLVCFVR